jgi:hypothetical protein
MLPHGTKNFKSPKSEMKELPPLDVATDTGMGFDKE